VPCQDDCFVDVCRGGDDAILIAITSDGAGSAERAEEGSALACETVLASVERWVETSGGDVGEVGVATAARWVEDARAAIAARAMETGLTCRDFACTLAVGVVGARAAAFLQIGDGAIVVRSGNAYEVVFWPDGGEYANMTWFLTEDDWLRHLHFDMKRAAVDEVAVMTDGVQRLALEFETRAAHEPFFQSMFRALRGAPPGLATALEPELVAFLDSDPVNARTDDDKTLVLATRHGGEADGTS
jgi:hypothetical protein